MSIYDKFGVTPVINATGTVTRLGGARMPAEVLAAIEQAAQQAVPLDQLQAAASERIAAATGTDAGLVTSGAAAALTLGAAAILAGMNPGRMERLPHCDGFACEFVVAREHRSGYDHAVRAAGAKLVEVGFHEPVAGAGVRRTEPWEFSAAFGPQTAGVLYVLNADSQPPLEDVVRVAHRADVPVLVDAAGELPPRENLTRIAQSHADLIAFSGGKAIRGPQATGILCGDRELIAAAVLQMLDMDEHFELWEPPVSWIDKQRLPGIPRHGIGRGMKVSKENIVGLLTALELFASGAYDDELPAMQRRLERIADAVTQYATTQIVETREGQGPPQLSIALNRPNPSRAAFKVCRQLRVGTPSIYVGHGRLSEGVLDVNPMCLTDDDAEAVAVRLAAVLRGDDD